MPARADRHRAMSARPPTPPPNFKSHSIEFRPASRPASAPARALKQTRRVSSEQRRRNLLESGGTLARFAVARLRPFQNCCDVRKPAADRFIRCSPKHPLSTFSVARPRWPPRHDAPKCRARPTPLRSAIRPLRDHSDEPGKPPCDNMIDACEVFRKPASRDWMTFPVVTASGSRGRRASPRPPNSDRFTWGSRVRSPFSISAPHPAARHRMTVSR